MSTAGGGEVGFLKVGQNLLGTVEYRLRHTGQTRDLNAIALVRGAFHNLAEKHDGIVVLAHSDIQVEHAWQTVAEFGEFVLVRGKQGLCTELLMQVFHDRPRKTEAIKGACAAPNFIQDHQAVAGGMMKDVRRLAHLNHESGLPARKVIAGADAREDAVEQIHAGLRGWHKAARVGE